MSTSSPVTLRTTSGPMSAHWSDAVFVQLRRLIGLRTELMVLLVADFNAVAQYVGRSSVNG